MDSIELVLRRYAPAEPVDCSTCPRDSRRAKCYDTEWELIPDHWNKEVNNPAELVKEICAWANVSVPTVKISDKKSASSWYLNGRSERRYTAMNGTSQYVPAVPAVISLSPLKIGGKYIIDAHTVIHECVHHIVSEYWGRKHVAHGAEFLAIACAFYAFYNLIDHVFGYTSADSVKAMVSRFNPYFDHGLFDSLMQVIEPDTA